MDILLVAGVNVIDSDLNFQCFVGIEDIRLEANCIRMIISQGGNMWHLNATYLERKSLKEIIREDIKIRRNDFIYPAVH